MASLRKKYSTHSDVGPRQDEPPVTLPPEVTAAELPPAVETKPVEPMVESSPAEEAGKNRLREELRKMENAEVLQRQQQPPQQPPPQQPQQAQEPIDPVEFVLANSGLPERAKAWLRKHPEYVLDQEKNAELQFHHFKARKEAEDFSDGYYGVLERHLGLSNGPAETKPTPQPTNHVPPQRPMTVDRPAPQRMSVPVSAPPTRTAPSMSTGRAPSYRAPLNKDELEVAASLGLTAEQYQIQKTKMNKMKQDGELQ